MKRPCSPCYSPKSPDPDPPVKGSAAWEIKRAKEEDDSDFEETPWIEENILKYSKERAPEDVENEDKMLQTMTCIVCLDLVMDIRGEGIFTCSSGHFICRDCVHKQKMNNQKECPAKCGIYTPAKNVLATEFMTRYLERNPQFCGNRSWGCQFKGFHDDRKKHMKFCPFRPIPCPAIHKGCKRTVTLFTLRNHLRQFNCAQVITSKHYSSRDEISRMHIFTYRGRFGTDNGEAFKLSEVKICKPILFMTPSTCKAGIFLQVERSETGTWHFSTWSLLDADGCKDMWVHLSVVAPTKRCYSAKIRLLPALTKTKSQAYAEGECMILVDAQIREVEFQDIGFDFALRILTTRGWKQQLNGEASKADQLRIEERLMGTVVPHKFQKYFPTVNGSKKLPLKGETPNECPTIDPEDGNKKTEESNDKESDSEKRGHYLLAAPPTLGQEDMSRPGLLGPPPPVTTGEKCPPLQIWPPAELAPSTSGGIQRRPQTPAPTETFEDEYDEEIDTVIARYESDG